jgi:hypothetical protein
VAVFSNWQLEEELQQLRARNEYLEYYAQPEIKESDAAARLLGQLKEQVNQWQNSLAQFQAAVEEKRQQSAALDMEIKHKQDQIVTFNDEILIQEFGLYEPRFAFASSTQYKNALESIRTQQKEKIKELDKTANSSNWLINGSNTEGRKMVKDLLRLLLRAYNSECDEIISKVKFSNVDRSVDSLRKSANTISKLGTVIGVSIPNTYVDMKVQEAYLAYEYACQKEQEKEEIKEARALLREELKVQKEIEEKRRALELEKAKYEKAYVGVLQQLIKDPNNQDLLDKKTELEETMGEVDAAIRDVDYREANKRAGFVYVISNVGSFGEGVFKIGMTRRLDPMERIIELSDASVPFNFDVHAMVFTDDAPTLEAALHKEFEGGRLNMVNRRREFFRTTIREIEAVINQNYDKTVDFVETPDAEQYRISLKMKSSGSQA